LLGVLPTDRPGVTVEPAAEMVRLTATSTSPVRCDGVLLTQWLRSRPVVADVLKYGQGAGTVGLQTSALPIGTIAAAVAFLQGEAERREDLKPIAAELETQRQTLADDLESLADGGPCNATSDDVRHRANVLALRSTQAA
jgi:hypothetical protein